MGEHVLFYVRDFLSPGYRAECSCGWLGREEHDTEGVAADEWGNHCDVVFMEATQGGQRMADLTPDLERAGLRAWRWLRWRWHLLRFRDVGRWEVHSYGCPDCEDR